MHHRLPLLAPLLLLAACGTGDPANFANRSGEPSLGEVREFVQSEGYRNYERPDGSFDRADYRRVNGAACRRGVRLWEQPPTPAVEEAFCTCLVDKLLLASDDQLRGFRSDRQYRQRAHGIVMTACAPVLEGRPPDPIRVPPGEPGAAPAPGPR